MTLLTVAKDVALDVGLEEPVQLFGSTEREHRELIRIAGKALREILNYHEWSVLKKEYTFTGDGVTRAFSMPADYHRMPKSAGMYSSTQLGSTLAHVIDESEWLRREVNGFTTTLGEWIVYGGQMHFRPAPALGEEIKFFYISDQLVTGKSAFTADADTFVMDEELLRLAMVWKWKVEKGMHVGEDLINFQNEASVQAGNDKGSKILTMGNRRGGFADVYAFPRAVGV